MQNKGGGVSFNFPPQKAWWLNIYPSSHYSMQFSCTTRNTETGALVKDSCSFICIPFRKLLLLLSSVWLCESIWSSWQPVQQHREWRLNVMWGKARLVWLAEWMKKSIKCFLMCQELCKHWEYKWKVKTVLLSRSSFSNWMRCHIGINFMANGKVQKS